MKIDMIVLIKGSRYSLLWGDIMQRRKFIVNIILWILSFTFGYKVGNAESSDSNIIIDDKEGLTNSEKIRILNEQFGDNTQDLKDRGVNIKNFGAKGDGEEDDTAAIQKAIDHVRDLGGGTVVIPNSSFKTSETLILYSNVVIEGRGPSSIIVRTNGGTVFKIDGTIELENPLSVNKTIGDTSISTVKPHRLKINDLVYLRSQRDAISSDAGLDWRLGYPTPDAQGCYFGEFLRVNRVVSAKEFKISSGLIFPYYRKDKAKETSPTARDYSTIEKVNPVQNVIVRNISVKGNYDCGIWFNFAFNCLVENVKFLHDGDSSSIIFQKSLSCKAVECKNYFDNTTFPKHHYYRNGFKCMSAQSCGFERCYSENASQAFDLSFANGGIPSLHCFVVRCETKGATTNSATSHGGTYACMFTDNLFLDNLGSGLAVRTRSSIISNNRVFGSNVEDASTYGISLYEGWARDCVVTGNSVSGFGKGIYIWDARYKEERFDWIGALIVNNVLTTNGNGIEIQRFADNKFLGDVGVLIQGNVIKANLVKSSKGILIHNYVSGVDIKDNIIDCCNMANAAIQGNSNCGNMRIKGNKFYNSTNFAIDIHDPTDTTTYPKGIEIINDDNLYFNISNPSRNRFKNSKLAKGYSVQLMNEKETPRGSLFIDRSDNKLKFKGQDGVVVTLA